MSCSFTLACALGLAYPWQDSDEQGLARGGGRLVYSRLVVRLIMSKLATGSNLTSVDLISCYAF